MKRTEMSLDGYLRKHTATIHLRTEQALEPLQLFNRFTSANYGTFIQIQYRWHKAMESLLVAANPSLVFDSYVYEPKVPLLEKDLKALGISADAIDFQEWKNPALPGIIYVLEGSMLGGTVISKHLDRQGVSANCRHYFTHCAEVAKTVWPLTRKYLQSIENTGYYFDACLKTSISCFEKMMEITKSEIALKTVTETLSEDPA